ncbi:hypothetical protein Pcryo_1792 [Psychrobacter cryohalolentis K5]|uniref:Uncharacterized protein n=2 Tax=Psychrobacter cryohalolentis TaxID=330922 RepID=Q1Q9T4_PSYCK|nr:hypothetical protein Pcryo_1792 [Psychrobacter cryohalolentis K5]
MYITLYDKSHFDRFSLVITQIMGHHMRKDAVSKNINITSQTSIKKKQFTEVGDMNECKTALEIMRRNKNTIEASLAFHNNVEKMKKEFVGKLKLDLYLNAKSYPQKLILRNMKVDNKYEKFSFGSIENIGIICFEFQDYYNKPSLGVRFLGKFRHSEFASEHKSRIKSLLNENIKNKQFESSSWWPAKDKFEPFDWRSSSKPWQMMKDDTMAIKILDEVLEIYKVLIENGYEIT